MASLPIPNLFSEFPHVRAQMHGDRSIASECSPKGGKQQKPAENHRGYDIPIWIHVWCIYLDLSTIGINHVHVGIYDHIYRTWILWDMTLIDID